jgi:signal transduction histidine kinase
VTAAAPRVLLVVRHAGNLRRLSRFAVDALGAEVVAARDDADVIVADAAGFTRERAAIEGARANDQPCLLVCSPREAERLVPDAWRVVDDVVMTPIRPDELRLRLERLIEGRKQALAAQRERAELKRSNVDLERFAFVAAHELVAPLAVVSGAVQTVDARFVDGADDTARQVLDAAVVGCRRMQALINDILDLSRAGRGGAGEEVDTQAVVDDVCDELREQIGTRGAVVAYDGLPVVLGDPSQLRLVFRNLLSNAIKFHRADDAPRISIDAEPSGDGWKFCVADNGRGIPPEERELVFDLFTRADRDEAVPGTGIGLAICRRIVERLGGRIWVEGREGPGAAFCFTVPTPRREGDPDSPSGSLPS